MTALSRLLKAAAKRPWTLLPARTLVNIKGATGEQVCQVRKNESYPDEVVIVLAVNNFEALVEALKERKDRCDRVVARLADGSYAHCKDELHGPCSICRANKELLAAIESDAAKLGGAE